MAMPDTPQQVPSHQGCLPGEQASHPCPPTQSTGLVEGRVEEGASQDPSPCLTTCLWELGCRPRHHK